MKEFYLINPNQTNQLRFKLGTNLRYKQNLKLKKGLVFFIFLITTFYSQSQNLKTITIDPITDMAQESLPFDQGFVLKKVYDNPVDIYNIGYFEIKRSQMKDYFITEKEATKTGLKFKFIKKDTKYELYIFVPPLNPNRFYDFMITTELPKTDTIMMDKYLEFFGYINAGNVTKADTCLAEINTIKQQREDSFEHPDKIKLTAFYTTYLKPIYDSTDAADVKKGKIIDLISQSKDDLFITGFWVSSTSQIFNFETRAKLSITPDFGYVYYGWQDDFYGLTPYLGFQIEFRYFDKNIPFGLIPNRKIWHRLSFNTGITLASLKKEGRRDDLFANKSLLIGMGFRLSNAVRITGGTILFNREDTNPIIDNKRLSATPFIGLSIDLSLKQMFTDFSSLIPIKRN